MTESIQRYNNSTGSEIRPEHFRGIVKILKFPNTILARYKTQENKYMLMCIIYVI